MQENIHYQRYFKFIASRPKRVFKTNGNLARHHIYPRAMGGLNNKGNIVVLTPREHFIAHMMLWKACSNRSMTVAFFLMARSRDMITSRQYEVLNQDVRTKLRGRTAWNKGKLLSEEHKQKLRDNHADFRGENSPSYGKRGKDNPLYGKPRPQHVCDAVSKYMSEHNPMKGRKWTEEERKKRAFVWTNEQKQLLSQKQKERRLRERLEKEKLI